MSAPTAKELLKSAEDFLDDATYFSYGTAEERGALLASIAASLLVIARKQAT